MTVYPDLFAVYNISENNLALFLSFLMRVERYDTASCKHHPGDFHIQIARLVKSSFLVE